MRNSSRRATTWSACIALATADRTRAEAHTHRARLELRRWRGGSRLAEALQLIREDSWSPAESHTRVVIVRGGLPEPELNVDLTAANGEFLACVDLAYLDFKIAIEYQSALHARQYAKDVERIERLRAHGWWVIQVTSALLREPERLVTRVSEALFERVWRGEPIWPGQ